MAFVRNEEDVLVGKPVDLFYKGFLCGYHGMLGNVVTLDHSTMFHILHISCNAADEPKSQVNVPLSATHHVHFVPFCFPFVSSNCSPCSVL